jgi:lon-related putative ATP-dependent protease
VEPGKPLKPDELVHHCNPDQFSFDTTDDLPDLDGFIGQERAIEAIRFGVRIDRPGYNIFALGPMGAGKNTLVHRYAQARAAEEPPPDDWCYVNNFDQTSKPRALRLPAGKGKQFSQDMKHLVEELQTTLSSAFESEEYQARRQALEAEFQERQQESLKDIQEQAKERGLALLRTAGGLVFAPLKEDGSVLEPEEYEKLDEEKKQHLQSEVEVMQERLQKVLYQVPRWEREFRQRLRDLNREVASFVLKDLLDDIRTSYAEVPAVIEHLDHVQADVLENLQFILGGGGGGGSDDEPSAMLQSMRAGAATRRYQVNLLVDSSDSEGAPVIYASNPSYLNLIGRVEQMAQMGALITDFTLIKPGLLHEANGGYLILDAIKVLSSPYAWAGLKRALQFGEIRIESPYEMLSLTSTVSLEPEPIPLDVKIIMMGERRLYYLLAAYDPDFAELFKVAADFDDEFVWDEESQRLYAQLIGAIVRREQLKPFDRLAVARIIEQSARLVSDSERLTARIQNVVDLMEEADYWADEDDAQTVGVQHVQQAIDAQLYRNNRVSQRMQEGVLRETILIDTAGEQVGQINGLAVLQLGAYAFGKPSRITATVRMGKGEVVDIEREVDMSGPIHSKGVLILSSLLRARYAYDRPLSLSASLVFEQSYGGVDGDSASSTELYALLSAIAQIPIKQSLAVTGSVNQLGQVQAIGGVNEKIEGFFELCQARGLTGDQGVLIPAANVKHLMLRQDVVDAVEAGEFAIYPVATIEEGIELLTGMPAGERDEEGRYPEGSFNRRVEDKLAEMMEKRIALDRMSRGDDLAKDQNQESDEGQAEDEKAGESE